ncbi:MAG: hypothetical protein A2Z91_08540 [Deltaproteobacteria bacterium GWA2_38_16]|nr:MAG: hypothetical protein A2Z91_08540 [Deltaproteobacteria bacterium GWA2_38_16]OGQ03841.1 MAG: hypothetical protein A3D19_07105 [Deltaproteobacteria bacterium RIFCSPHIGHO2_02_FULL_38_15]OGQ31502.1 MAG: hypothetical protein A3A72_09205 [Deltaproteobacteria bacterium RIFCSPLOWO2_01_FULL_38_9]OGQ63918.1 MAG: hypothetical protein A3G92_08015 [Deltaproteobacteria bacterium RIFCSPLOWO2_12_FULL_38_8]
MYRCALWVCDGLSVFLNFLPKSFLKFLARGIVFVWYWIIPFRINVVQRTLTIAYGQEKTKEEIQHLLKQNLLHYVYLLIEFIQWRTLSLETIQKRTQMENLSVLLEALKENKGVILLTAHLGNFEWMAGVAPLFNLPLHIIVRPMKSKLFEHIISSQRQKTGVSLMGPENSNWHILDLFKKNQIVGVIFDQRRGSGILVDFFKKPALTTQGLAYLLERSEAIVVPVYTYRSDLGEMVVHVDPAVSYKKVGTRKENIYYNTQRYTDVVEQMVRCHPEQWFWIHDRWKM